MNRFPRLKSQSGQTSMFMALFIMTMILMFAFTTNIGMLVHAKINLQNAADAAAYSGAAVQARQLTNVAYLNWEMRRALKEFLFYYQIRSQYAAMPCFPNNALGQNFVGSCPPVDGNGRHDFAFFDPREGGNNETNGPFIPSVCIIFSGENNYCQKFGVPGIPEFQGGGSWGVADPIVSAVRAATDQIIQKKINDCLSRTQINASFLAAWLLNINPIKGVNMEYFTTGRDSDDPFPSESGLERAGILPRMAILRARIDNFEEALNMNLGREGLGTVTLSDQNLMNIKPSTGGAKDMDYFERPVQAFLSAKNNLTTIGDNGIFADIELTELLPNQPGAPTSGAGFDNQFIKNPPVLVKFKDQFARVTLAYSRFETTGQGDRGNCFQYRQETVIPHFPFGISKYPGLMTYYAVRLQAKARLLFSPFGGNGIVTLAALSAAKPFGSRIGKDLNFNSDTEFHQMVALGKLSQGELLNTLTSGRFPNVLVSDDDTDSQFGGFARNSHLGYIRQAMNAMGNLAIGPRLAGAYAPWEVGYYTVPANYNFPERMGLFEDNPVYDGKFFAMKARIMPVNSEPGIGFLRTRVAEYLNGGPADAATLAGRFGLILNQLMSDPQWAALYGYLQAEGQFDSYYIPDPMLSDEPQLLSYIKNNGGQRFTVAAMPNAQLRQFTSWNNQKTAIDQDIGILPTSELGPDIGRSGYSVRFISFRTLQAGGQGTNDPIQPNNQWNNPFPRVDAGAGSESNYLEEVLRKLNH